MSNEGLGEEGIREQNKQRDMNRHNVWVDYNDGSLIPVTASCEAVVYTLTASFRPWRRIRPS